MCSDKTMDLDKMVHSQETILEDKMDTTDYLAMTKFADYVIACQEIPKKQEKHFIQWNCTSSLKVFQNLKAFAVQISKKFLVTKMGQSIEY